VFAMLFMRVLVASSSIATNSLGAARIRGAKCFNQPRPSSSQVGAVTAGELVMIENIQQTVADYYTVSMADLL
jgi:hypothetical protein